ncbi:hypothetical protein KJZ61_04025 [Candidatus Dependentiae bacterium]|nr:hypothetical protein [Candidatus Dependentiae bacterium]
MLLLKSWKESLEVFLPKNIMLFGKLTVNTMLRTMKAWLSTCWWLLLVWILVTIITAAAITMVTLATRTKLFKLVVFVHLTMLLIIVLTLVIAARPSVTIKNCRYYFSYWRHMLLVVGMFGIMFFALENMHKITKSFPSMNTVVLQYIILPTALAFLFLWIIAFLDTKFHIYALWSSFIRALKLVIYNYPFVWVMSAITFSMAKIFVHLIVFLIFYDPHPCMFSGLAGLVLLFTGLIFPILGAVLIIPVLLLLSTMTNMYTRQVHEHFDRYY